MKRFPYNLWVSKVVRDYFDVALIPLWLALGTHYIFNNSSEAPNRLFLLPLTLVFWIIHWFLRLSSGDSNSSSFSFLPLFKKLSTFTDLYL